MTSYYIALCLLSEITSSAKESLCFSWHKRLKTFIEGEVAALSQGHAGVCNPSDNIFYKIFLNLVKSLITLPYPGKVTITLHPKGEKKANLFSKINPLSPQRFR